MEKLVSERVSKDVVSRVAKFGKAISTEMVKSSDSILSAKLRACQETVSARVSAFNKSTAMLHMHTLGLSAKTLKELDRLGDELVKLGGGLFNFSYKFNRDPLFRREVIEKIMEYVSNSESLRPLAKEDPHKVVMTVLSLRASTMSKVELMKEMGKFVASNPGVVAKRMAIESGKTVGLPLLTAFAMIPVHTILTSTGGAQFIPYTFHYALHDISRDSLTLSLQRYIALQEEQGRARLVSFFDKQKIPSVLYGDE